LAILAGSSLHAWSIDGFFDAQMIRRNPLTWVQNRLWMADIQGPMELPSTPLSFFTFPLPFFFYFFSM
jgi:hypothetical protein